MSRSRRVVSIVSIAAIAATSLAACGGGKSSSSDTSGGAKVPSTDATGQAVYPLTGLPVTDPAAAARVPIAAKIDNHPDARPQNGLNSADIVFEENVESLTRFAAIFQSGGSDPVGPLRSGRTQDVNILGSYNHPLFVWSGGNARVTATINKSDLVNVGYSASKGKGGYFRDNSRKAPHNLYASTTTVWKNLTPAGSGAPQPQFIYRGPSDAMPTTATPIDGAHISMYNVKVQWLWDKASGNWLRSTQNLKRTMDPHIDKNDGSQVSAKNIVDLEVVYKKSKADRKSPEAQTTGKGTGYVLTNGAVIPITWTRADRTVPFTLTDANGAVVRLTPGRTWVELSFLKAFAQINPGVDPKTVAWPQT